MIDYKAIDKKVEQIHRTIWENKDLISFKNPIELLQPAFAAKLLGINYNFKESLGKHIEKGIEFEVAGLLERNSRKITISKQFDPTVMYFTFAHELGHWLLHEDEINHRDRPLNGSIQNKSKIEKEADYFASNFLMPKNILTKEFQAIFKSYPLKINEDLLFSLGIDKSDVLKNLEKDDLYIERVLAKANSISGSTNIPLSKRFNVSPSTMAIRIKELGLIYNKEKPSRIHYLPKIENIKPITVEPTLLPTTKYCFERKTIGQPLRILVIQHALRDTYTFLKLAKENSITIGAFIAKPNSIDEQALKDIKSLRVPVIQEPKSAKKPYHYFENTDLLDREVKKQIGYSQASNQKLILVDVGGYFCKVIKDLSSKLKSKIAGVVEVTTFGHNRYINDIDKIDVPIVSIAKSKLKSAEAVYVGDSVIRATEDILQERGLSLSNKTCCVNGFGMIGSEIANSLKKKQIRVRVADTSPIKRMEAHLRNFETGELSNLLNDTDLLFSATGTQAIKLDDIKNAKSGIMLISGGSKAQEFDIAGITSNSKDVNSTRNIKTYQNKNKKLVSIVNEGKAVNFLKDGTPEEIMDLVFSEKVEAIRQIIEGDTSSVGVKEVLVSAKELICDKWLALQNEEHNSRSSKQTSLKL
jgi:adenosylhomocysteinase